MYKLLIVFLICFCSVPVCQAAGSEKYAWSSDYMEKQGIGGGNPEGQDWLWIKKKKTVSEKDYIKPVKLFVPYRGWGVFNFYGFYGFSPQAGYLADSTSDFGMSFTAGGNFSKYFGIQSSVYLDSLVSKDNSFTMGLSLMLVIQKEMDITSYGFRPYFGLGGSLGLLVDLKDDSYISYGLAMEGGLRYFYNNFLVGVNVNFNLDFARSYFVSNYDPFPLYSQLKFGIHIGFIF